MTNAADELRYHDTRLVFLLSQTASTSLARASQDM